MNVVITGSTRGIGLGLARAFLKRGHVVVVSSRSQPAVEAAIEQLRDEPPAGEHVGQANPQQRVHGQTCDVRDREQVQALWNHAQQTLGSVDIWINNAGRDAARLPFHQLPPKDYELTVQTNLLGVMHGSHVALRGMLAQGRGALWNMEGFGSDGATMLNFGPYSATKCAVRSLTKTLVKECAGSPVTVGFLSPGMVITDLLIDEAMRSHPDWPKKRKIYNILADTVETVTPWLVDGMLRHPENGAAVRWLTRRKVFWRFLTAKLTGRDVLTPLGL